MKEIGGARYRSPLIFVWTHKSGIVIFGEKYKKLFNMHKNIFEIGLIFYVIRIKICCKIKEGMI